MGASVTYIYPHYVTGIYLRSVPHRGRRGPDDGACGRARSSDASLSVVQSQTWMTHILYCASNPLCDCLQEGTDSFSEAVIRTANMDTCTIATTSHENGVEEKAHIARVKMSHGSLCLALAYTQPAKTSHDGAVLLPRSRSGTPLPFTHNSHRRHASMRPFASRRHRFAFAWNTSTGYTRDLGAVVCFLGALLGATVQYL